MTIEGLLARITALLDAAGIPYMVTGSYASSLHSIPRATRDLDIVVFPDRNQLTRFMELLQTGEYHADSVEALDALRRRAQFNVIDYATGWKVDFIIPAFDEFHLAEFDRRRLVEAGGVRLYVASAEDVVIAKLAWAKAGQSERQLEDVATVVRVQGDSLDRDYVERWVRRLELHNEWEMARRKAGR